jgi:PAS domain S-box-containing protein
MTSCVDPAEKKTVLVVDDDPSTRLLAASTLSNAGFGVREAESGEDAISSFNLARPDIVLLDVMMPGMDGFTVCRELRKLPGGRHVPVMMMTGLEDVDSIHRSFQAGATDFITKPINWVILGYRVACLLRASVTFDELNQSERKNLALLNAIPDTVIRIGKDGTFLDVLSHNDQDLFLPREELLGKKIADVLPPEVAHPIMQSIAGTFRTKETRLLECALPVRGAEACFEARFVANEDREVFVIVRNITERKQAERQARFHSRRLELIGRINKFALQESDIHEVLLKMSRDIREILSIAHCVIRIFEEPEIKVESHRPAAGPMAFLPRRLFPDGGPRAMRPGDRIVVNDLRKGPAFGKRETDPACEGAFLGIPLSIQGSVFGFLHLEDDRPHKWTLEEILLGVAISRQVALAVRHIRLFQVQQELADRLLSVMSNVPGIIYRGLPDWTVAFIGGARPDKVCDYTQEEMRSPSFSFLRVIPPEHRKDVISAMRAAVAKREEYIHLEYPVLCKHGGHRWISDHRRLAYDEKGALLHIDGLIQDVNDRKSAEEAHARLSMAVEQAGESIIVADASWNIQYVNPAFERISGYSRDEAVGRNAAFLGKEEDLEAVRREIWTSLLEKKDHTGLLISRHKDGTLYQEEAVISPVRNPAGKVVNFVFVKRDVTNERMMEDQLRQSQKMEAVGRMAGGTAHDFNNILTAILGFCDLLLSRLREDDPIRRDLLEIRKAGDRGANITRQLLAFSRRQVLQPKVMNLNDAIAGIDNMIRRLLGEDIDIHLDLGRALGNVRIDPGQIEQVLVNLAVNARDAMHGGGTLTIRTSNATFRDDPFSRRAPVPPGSYVMLEIADQGAGMDDATKSRIFEPFFTTKEKGKGTGLGLSTVYGIVNQSGGHVWADSAPGEGTTFRICLPRVVEEAEGPGASEDDAGAGRGETVLLAEDEPAVRNIARIILRDSGYTVLEAANGEEALDIARSHAGKISLLLTDMVMPRMGGLELAEKLAPLRRETKILFMSGYPEKAVHLDEIMPRGTSFLMKPFNSRTLSDKVRRTLDSCPA